MKKMSIFLLLIKWLVKVTGKVINDSGTSEVDVEWTHGWFKV